MNWLYKNIISFILSISPVILFIIYLIYRHKVTKIKYLRILIKPRIIITAVIVINITLLLNLIITGYIDRSIVNHYNKFVGQPASSVEHYSIKTVPWYSLWPSIIDEFTLFIYVENDTIRACIEH